MRPRTRDTVCPSASRPLACACVPPGRYVCCFINSHRPFHHHTTLLSPSPSLFPFRFMLRSRRALHPLFVLAPPPPPSVFSFFTPPRFLKFLCPQHYFGDLFSAGRCSSAIPPCISHCVSCSFLFQFSCSYLSHPPVLISGSPELD